MKRIALVAIGVVAVTAAMMAQDGMRGGGMAQGGMAQGGMRRGGPPPPPPPLEPGASQADVDLALLAAPGNLKGQATVIKFNKEDFTYKTLRKGTNRLVCFDRSGFALQQPFSIMCTSVANIEREVQNMKAEATGDRQKSEAMLTDMEKNGTRAKPEFGSVWYHMAGPDREHARPEDHITIAVPMATSQSLGLPDNPSQGGVWIMNAGTMKAHLMVPGS